MLSKAYYNENDPFAAAWLRNLISAGHIAAGDVDERSIEDVKPSDLLGYTQCHFFAGIGGWSYALRLAGWPDDRPAWTGSCPCQPFSNAGKGAGFTEERHLWPAFFHLIKEFRPDTIFGEQVTAAIKHGWLDLVQNDLEGIGYAFAPHGLAACNLGAPHQRKRLYFVAHNPSNGRGKECPDLRGFSEGNTEKERASGLVSGVATDELVLPESQRRCGRNSLADGGRSELGGSSPDVCLVDSDYQRLQGRIIVRDGSDQRFVGPSSMVNGRWSDAVWLWCRDEKYRPIEPGTFPLAHGVPARVGRLRGYGNAIVPQVAASFIQSYIEGTENGRV